MQSESPLDTLISAADRALRAVFAPARASRPLPVPPSGLPVPVPAAAAEPVSAETMDRRAAIADADRRSSAALMRVNHAGEIAAQALYHGQALVARSTATRDLLLN